MTVDGTSPRATAPLRILLYGQHLSGVGHYVRTWEIARELARHHDVHLVEGGRLVPRAPAPAGLHAVDLPRLVRRGGRIVPLDSHGDTAAVFSERRQLLQATLARLRPHVLVIEYYPFSRWDLTAEITALLTAARDIRPGMKIVCSVRDIPRQTMREDAPAGEYERTVLDRLHAWFDAVMVHGDPRFTRLGDSFAAVDQIRLPVAYTGIVAQKLNEKLNEHAGGTPGADLAAARIRQLTGGAPYVLVSAGGGADPGHLLDAAIGAWDRLLAAGEPGDHLLVLAPGLGWSAERLAQLRETLAGRRALLLEFTPDFLHWMRFAAVSVSCAGYNTCANILATGARAVLVPDPTMPDQAARAELFVRHGFAERVLPAALDAGALAAAILRSRAGAGCRHDLDLDGAVRSREFIEQLQERL